MKTFILVLAMAAGVWAQSAIGTFTDSRDGKKYRTTKIGEQIWMAQNLNYHGSDGYLGLCYGDEPQKKIKKPENCEKYGRLYDWAEAQTACPKGWNLPSVEDFDMLLGFVGGWSVYQKKLKAKSGWDAYDFSKKSPKEPKCKWTEEEIDSRGRVTIVGKYDECATDEYGFSALPSGVMNGSNTFDIGRGGYWWHSNVELDGKRHFSLFYAGDGFYSTIWDKISDRNQSLFSVRCIQDVDPYRKKTSPIWNGKTDTKWYKESQNYFIIRTAEQLAGLARLASEGKYFHGQKFILGANIMLNDTTNWKNWANKPPKNKWIPIGDSEWLPEGFKEAARLETMKAQAKAENRTERIFDEKKAEKSKGKGQPNVPQSKGVLKMLTAKASYYAYQRGGALKMLTPKKASADAHDVSLTNTEVFFNANGYTISGVYSNDTNRTYQGLFFGYPACHRKYQCPTSLINVKLAASYIGNSKLISRNEIPDASPSDYKDLHLNVIISNDYFQIWANGDSLPKIFFTGDAAYFKLAESLKALHKKYIDSPDVDAVTILVTGDIDFGKIAKVMDRAGDVGFVKIGPLAKVNEEEFIEAYINKDSDGIGDGIGGLKDESTGGIGSKARGGLKAPSARDIDMGSGEASRSKAEIMAVVNARLPGLRNIYNKYLNLKPDFSGKVTLKFTIAPGGDIISISIESSTTGYSEFDNAIKNMVATWKWKAIKSGDTTPTIPFSFVE